MTPNPGHLPTEAVGKRVRVRLANGNLREWPADGRHGCGWERFGMPSDITEYEVIR